MNDMPMMTMEDAKGLVEQHNLLCHLIPTDYELFCTAMLSTLHEAVRMHKAASEQVAYILENVYIRQSQSAPVEQEKAQEDVVGVLSALFGALLDESEE